MISSTTNKPTEFDNTVVSR